MNIIETNLNFNSMLKRSKTEGIILHNSGVTTLQSVETIHNFHKNINGWSGIGYHFYIRKNGEIYRGRPEDKVGAHAINNNSNTIGICFEGNFNEEILTNEQIKSGKELIIYLIHKYNILFIKGHKEVCNTSCPR